MSITGMLVGFVAGFISSLGLGGGGVLVMFLTVFLSVGQLRAQGINLLFFIPVGCFALFWHIRKKLVNFRLALPAVCAGLPGAFLGSLLADWFGSGVTRKIFGVLLLLLGAWELAHPVRRGGADAARGPRQS